MAGSDHNLEYSGGNAQHSPAPPVAPIADPRQHPQLIQFIRALAREAARADHAQAATPERDCLESPAP